MARAIYSVVLAPLAGFSAYKPTKTQVNVAFNSKAEAELYLDNLYELYHNDRDGTYRIFDIAEYGRSSVIADMAEWYGEFILRENLHDNEYLDYAVFITKTALL